MSDAAAPPESPQLELLEHAAERVFARYGILMIGCWRGPSTIEHLRLLSTHYAEQRRRYPEGFLTMTIFEQGVPFTHDAQMLEFGRATRKEFGSSVVRQAYVIPHAGLGGTMLRLTANSIMRLVPSTPAKVFPTVTETLRWLDQGPIKIPDRARLELELPVALGLRASTVRGSVRHRDA